MPRESSRTRPRAATNWSRGLVAVVASSALVIGAIAATMTPASADTASDLARYGTLTADKVQSDAGSANGGYFPASNATDGDDTTRWASGNGTDSATAEWKAVLTEDLGAPATITDLTLKWEASYASGYRVEVASAAPGDPSSWTEVYSTTTGDGGTDTFPVANADPSVPVTARYVRLDLDKRGPVNSTHYYGYSIYTLSIAGAFTSPQVGFGTLAPSAAAGSSATIPILLSNPAATDQTVHVSSADGTAQAGKDYTAVDQDVTIQAGSTVANVTVPTTVEGPLAPTRTAKLTLSSPSSGIALNAGLTTATLTITPTGTIQNVGGSKLLDDFESGVPSTYAAWGQSSASTPALSTATAAVPGAPEGNHALVATLGATGSYYGFTYEPKNGSTNVLLDWSAYDGFSFWFLGKNTGKTFSFELHNRNASNTEQGFTTNVVDNVAGWRRVTVLFKDLKAKSGNTLQTFNPSISTGFAVTLTGFGAVGAYTFDDFTLFQRAALLDDFEPPFAVGNPAAQIGYRAVGASGAVSLDVTSQARGGVTGNHVLSGTYQVPADASAGVQDTLPYSQDWSSFRGLQFWWYASQPTEPASATTGANIAVRLADGGPDSEHSEVWSATFRDNWADGSRWKLVQIPFSSFALADDALQHGDVSTKDGILGLNSTWGFTLGFPDGTASTPFSIDDVQLYGTPALQTDVSVSVPDVTLVDAGKTAKVALTLTTATGNPTTAAVAVKYATGTSAAVSGTDYTPTNGTITFPAGTATNTTMTFDVATLAGAAQAKALTIPLTITNPAITLPLTAPIVVINAHGFPYLDSSLPVGQRVTDLLGRMSLADKVGQMTQAERGSLSNPRQIPQLGLGSVLSGGGSVPAGNSPSAWASMVDGFQSEALAAPLQIPIVYGADAVHGHSNVKNATIYPHNIGLGATRDPSLVEQIGKETASETRTTGVTWAFAPCLCVSRDERWGRTYESYGEDPALVSSFAGDAIKGLQGSDPTDKSGADEVLASAKHWAGDGGTSYDASKAGTGAYPIDQGITHVASEQEFETLFAAPYVPAISAGVGTIMPSYSSLSIDGSTPIKMTANKALDTDLLKGTMGFDGFLISDWQAIGQIPGQANYAAQAVTAVNAGLDMAMEPSNYTGFINAIVSGVQSEQVSQDRVNDAVARILTQKFELGLFEKPFTNDSQRDQFGGTTHRATAAQAAAQSQVLLKNTGGALPLAKTGKLYVAGSNADDLGNQMGGWTLSWQGGSGKGMTAGTTILEGIKADAPNLDVTYSKTASAATAGYDRGLVVVGETPYAEGQGDVGNNNRTLNLSAADTAAINTVCSAMTCTVLVVSGRPQMIGSVVPQADAVVAGFLPGSEGEGVASVLLGDQPFTGRLPLSWPASMAQIPVNVGDADYNPQFAYGWGLRTDAPRARLTTLVGELTGAAKSKVQALLDADVWKADGTLSDPQVGLRLLAGAAQELTQVTQSVVDAASVETAQAHPIDPHLLRQADTLVSVARDLAQQAIVAQGATPAAADVSATADAEHNLESGDAYDAVRLLASVAGVDVTQGEGAAPTATTLPSISGTPQVGATLTADAGVWSVEGVHTSIQWNANGVAIEGASGATYVPTAEVLGKTITVTVTATKAGHADGTATSAATGAVVAAAVPALASTGRPVISGTPRVGATLTAKPGTWNASGVTFTYQWTASGKPIAGATRSTYTLTAAQLNAAVSVTVTARKVGYTSGTAASASTSRVAAGKVTSLSRPGISGKAKVGKRLTAKPGRWSVAGLTYHYQWYASGTRIKGATKAKLTLHKRQAGQRVTVKVTVSRAGYLAASAASKATAKVKRR